MEGLISSFEAYPDVEIFMTPVDWEELEIKDYPEVIKNPMDLGTVKANLKNGNYNSFDAVFADISLIWANAI